MTQPTPLVSMPPRTAAIVVVVVEGPPPFVQIDLFDTRAGATDRVVARYTTGLKNTLEAASAFELLLSGTLWGQPHDMKGLEITHLAHGKPT